MYLTPDFWIDRTARADEVLADEGRTARIVRHAFRDDPNLVDLASYPEHLPPSAVADLIRSISKPYDEDLYYPDGNIVLAEDYARYARNLNIHCLADPVTVRFGMILRRADMRTWPTADAAIQTPEMLDLDRFQENALFPADVVAILHESADGQWCFVQSYNYAAWVSKEKVVTGKRRDILGFHDDETFLVVAGSNVRINFNPKASSISELQLDMGVRLPLLRTQDVGRDIDGQDPRSSHVVRLPVRGKDGELAFRSALIARSQDVSIGHMPYTRRNILHQSFKFLGERYGWGHSYNARDCSGLVTDVYKTFGILLPRNTIQQEQSPVGASIRFSGSDGARQKLEALEDADAGDLLFSPGHVMMYIGNVDGEAWVIHSLFGAGWTGDDGRFEEGALNGVSVTPLRDIYASADATYFDQLQSIKRIR